ncbi:tetratricopeptide repeat protein [Aetokthonos hydrillicola Thurmond2011]|jgi:tetratricopeptide (TPR) repeat protein|uniref:Tetratricopeptide repeat protein n=1 Tax=Aetokthonos hydrillicola Thurmond2011 TaxID=2712845 RepID=A0AAP5IDY0_9CYAN|nr:tetratricopeptide repeat protein [Aetokthonos hydrillicola]MBO3459702.1 tetratricopeptide repeat protein [Aetokthonos hydrillicola CCALA 1050]MBW4588552.1 tetratricopeptide repeat protein [Aetokthonos hydrillicola CCALA 1050]MDR9899474.1 tetratricopeptide repeat protein [Aetokthonos hydrillicola Thurmond2011]
MTNHPDFQVVQRILENVQAGRDITIGDIHQIYQIVINLDNIPKPTGFPQNIPLSSTDKFIGRERELEHLRQQLQQNTSVVIAPVEGMGGVGKTELAIQYSLLHLQLHSYPGGICWLRAREEDIGSQIIQFTTTDLGKEPPKDLPLPEQVRWCWQHWQQGHTLIVFDDVKNYSHIQPYLPPQPSQFKVIITTRLRLDLASSLFLSVLSETDALLLLAQLIGKEKQNQELGQGKELCQRLGYLPLALQLVGSYVKKRKITLAEMLRRLEEKGLAHPSLIVKENDPTWTRNVKLGVAAAFELSWSDLSHDAQQLGCLLSLFALAPIPWSLVKRAAVEQNPEKLEDTRVELENLHLLQGEQTYQLHQLIREFLRDKQNNLATAFEQKSQLCKTLVEVAQKIPSSLTQEFISLVKDDIPHLVEVAKNLIDAVSDQNLIWPFVGLNRFYSGQALYAFAEPRLEQCVLVVKSRLGEEHHDFASSYNNLAFVYYSQGRYSEAEPLYQKSLELRQRLLGEEHLDVASSYNNLALLYHSQGRYSEAEPLYQKSLELRQRLLGEEHLDVASSYDNLAGLYHSQGRYSEAEPLYQKSLELRQRLLGEEHLDVASSYNNLAGLYYSQGRYGEAEPLYQKSLELWKKLLGEEHPSVATSYNNLAGLYYSQGRYGEAEPLYQKSLELWKKLLGEEHPNVASCYNNLAELYCSLGRYSEAEPLYKTALSLCQRLLGEEHPFVATTYNNLAKLYYFQGRYQDAEPLFKKALEIASKGLGVDHPTTAKISENMKLLRDNYAGES